MSNLSPLLLLQPPGRISGSMISDELAMVLHSYLTVFGGVVLVYDYALTFSMEVERFWLSHQASTTTALYFVNRYMGLVGYLPILYQFLAVAGGDVCRRLQSYGMFYSYFVLGCIGALMAVRVYALYNRNPIVLWVMGTQVVLSVTVCLVLRWVGILGNGMVPGRPPPPVHCVPYNTQKQGKGAAAAWSFKPLFDLMVLLLTVYKSAKFKRVPRPALIDVLIADGMLYFAGSLILNSLTVFFCLWAPPYLRAAGTPLTTVICSTIASRMTLNLRDPDLIPYPTESSSDSTPESEQLVSTILSLGHPSYAASLISRSDVESSVIPLRRRETQGVD